MCVCECVCGGLGAHAGSSPDCTGQLVDSVISLLVPVLWYL